MPCRYMTDLDKDLCCAIKSLNLADLGKVRHRTRIVMPEAMDLVLYCESKDSFVSARGYRGFHSRNFSCMNIATQRNKH